MPTATQYTTMTQLVRERVYKFLSIDNMQAYTESTSNGMKEEKNLNLICVHFSNKFIIHSRESSPIQSIYKIVIHIFKFPVKLTFFPSPPQITWRANLITWKSPQRQAKFSGCWLCSKMARSKIKITRHRIQKRTIWTVSDVRRKRVVMYS